MQIYKFLKCVMFDVLNEGQNAIQRKLLSSNLWQVIQIKQESLNKAVYVFHFIFNKVFEYIYF